MNLELDTSTLSLISQLREMPKVDLHRHLEGSLRLQTLAEISREHGLDLPTTPEGLRPLICMTKGDPRTAAHFLAKFKAVRQFFQSLEIIDRLVGEVVADAAEEGIAYLELLFTPQALAAQQDLDLKSVFDVVLQSAQQSARRYPIQVHLIASINRHEPLPIAEKVVQLALERRGAGLVGLDLAGDESHFGAEPFQPVFQEARQGGLHLTVHAGEWGGPENIRFAVEALGAQRIGHGVRMLEDPSVLARVREHQVACEVCLTSNRLTGVDDLLPEQPLIRLLQAGLQVTLNSDDPTILGTSLSQEFALAIRDHGLTIESLKGMTLAAVQAAFLQPKEKKALEADMITRLMNFHVKTGGDG
jgi:adenosine deaminase